ncbi:protein of unknown function [Fibrobacter sp. UWB10]|nr:DUF4157 domain-containing protein [Fibrobacter sp. UWB10]SMP55572.1 protein of unknown function [Fibrobacter sp. UWB10]
MSTTYAQKSSTVQKVAGSKAASLFDSSSQSESLQRKANMANNAVQREESPRPNNTGMPDNLKSGIESLSGFSMDDVRVHYNSSKPTTVQALAYTQGTDIHVAPGQEKHLPHEAWHVAQQMAGRVSPTTNINGMPVNDNASLEHEADVMGDRAISPNISKNNELTSYHPHNNTMVVGSVSQFVGQWEKEGQLEKWSNLRSGVRWYRYSDNGRWYRNSDNGRWYKNPDYNKIWYRIENEEAIPQQLKKSYKAYCGKKLSREIWVKIHELWANSELKKEGCPKFGMEVELDRNRLNGSKHGFQVAENTPEENFKAKSLFSIADGLVDVTFDTDTNYDTQKRNPSELVIELVFDALKIPLYDDLYAIGENIALEIQDLTYAYIERKRNQDIGKGKITPINVATDHNKTIIDKDKLVTFGIHVTAACPLRNIFKVKKPEAKSTTGLSHNAREFFQVPSGMNPKDVYNFYYLPLKADEQQEIKNCFDHESFLFPQTETFKKELKDLISKHTPTPTEHDLNDDVQAFFDIINSFNKDSSKDDPKSTMSIMNRTSFGKIFSLMSPISQQQVILNFDNKVDQFYYGKQDYRVDKQGLYTYLTKLFNTINTINIDPAYTVQCINSDPTYVAAEHEKYGISGLGDSTESINQEECPIFEFRGLFDFNGKKIDKFPEFIQNIANLFLDKGIR